MARPKGDVPRQTIGMRVPVPTVEKIDGWAAERGMNRSDAFRVIMQAGLIAVGLAASQQVAAPTPGRSSEPGLLDRLGVPPMRAPGTARRESKR